MCCLYRIVGVSMIAGNAFGADGGHSARVAYSISAVIPAALEADVFDCDFDAESVGVCTLQHVQMVWRNSAGGAPTWADGIADGRCSIVEHGTGGKALAILYPSGGVGPAQSGAQWKFPLGRRLDSATVEYRIRFPAGADFGKGGKLPGFCGGTAPTGGGIPTGADGFSARVMWRNGSAGADKEHGYICQYMYNVHQVSEYGDDLWWASPPIQETGAIGGHVANWNAHKSTVNYFVPDTWHTVRTYVKINDVGADNAIVRSWLDDRLVLNATNLTLRTVDTFGVDLLYFSTFYGGNTSDWAPSADQTILFDDFKIWNGEKPALNMADLRLDIPAGAPVGRRAACLFGESSDALEEIAVWPGSAGNAALTHRVAGLRIGHPYVYVFEVCDADGALAFAATNSLVIRGFCAWTGSGADADWLDPRNWDYGVPGEFASVTIPDSANVALTSSVKIASLDMGGRAALRFVLSSASPVMLAANGDIFMETDTAIIIDAGDFSGSVELMRAGGMISALPDKCFVVSPRKGYSHRVTQSANAILFSRYRQGSCVSVR